MVARSISLALALVTLASFVRAQEAQPDVENSKFQFTGVVNSNAVFIRSGPSENDYPTMKLDKGAELTVVGERFNWLKIVPPPGSFCYVAKAFVNRVGNGSSGQASQTIYVRVGSDLNPLKTKVATKLEPGQRVEIIGEQDEYFKIKPPQDAYFYVSKQFVDPVRPVTAEQPATPALPDNTATRDNSVSADAGRADSAISSQQPAGEDLPVQPPPQATVAPVPTTQSVASAEQEFDQLEALYGEASAKPLDEQPIAELLAGYEKLATSSALPESLRRICDFKVGALRTRAEMKAQFAEVKQMQESMKQKQMALKAEQSELEDLVKKSEVKFYTAVGTLRTSSLQQGVGTLYRLTDPANARTVVYVRSEDPKLAQMLGQFIGIRGQVTNDTQLGSRVVALEAFEPVNPGQVGQKVASQIVPPSLLPRPTGTAKIE